jgi:hypothetical protein
VARRRYGKPSPAISTAGQAAHGRDPSGDESLSQPIEPLSEYGKPPPEPAQPQPAQPVSGLGQQLHDMRQQAQQQQYAQQPQIDPLMAYLASIPNMTMPKLGFLYQHFAQRPHLLNGDYWQLLRMAHDITTKERGIPDDSGEYFQSLNQLLAQHAPPPHAAPAPPPPMPPMPPVAHVDISKTESADTGEPEAESVAAHFVSAPVARGDHGTAIEPELSPSQIRLSKAEREHAAASGVSDEVYAANKLKMMRLKAAKVIRDE